MISKKLSLTKHYVFDRLVDEIGSLQPGMTEADVRGELGSPHPELADDIFAYDEEGSLLDSLLIQSCRQGGGTAASRVTALRVIWVSLVAADERLQLVLRFMSEPNGKLNESLYKTTTIAQLLKEKVAVDSRKAASNLAHYFEQARIFEPDRYGPAIVGVARALDTESAVPLCIAHLAEVSGWDDPPEQAVNLGVHRWLNLTEERFKELATSAMATAPPDEEPHKPPPVAVRSPKLVLELQYVVADEKIGIVAPWARHVDPDVLENATREHRATQNKLAKWAQDKGFKTVRPYGDPLFDVGWWSSNEETGAEKFCVAEVKSLGVDNEVRQVRLGLGQVLDYRKQLKDAGFEAVAVLAVSRKPVHHKHWNLLAADLKVVFCWPPFAALDEWLKRSR